MFDVISEAKCSLSLVVAFLYIQLSEFKVCEKEMNLIFVDLAKVNPILLTV
jgi:hypothetical protein